MRLIDAEKCPCILCEDTRNAHCTYEHRSCEKFCNWLNNAAFDTEKVVEQLEVLHDLVNDNQKLAVSQSIDIVKKAVWNEQNSRSNESNKRRMRKTYNV